MITMLQRAEGRLLRRTFAVLAVLLLLLGATGAGGETTMTVTREVAELDEAGWFVPGTTELTFTLTFTLGGDMGNVTALAWEDELPTGWTYKASSLVATPAPFIVPADGASGTLEFAWLTIPTFPFTMTYVINVPPDPILPATVSGQAEFRLLGPAQFSNIVENTFRLEPARLTATRYLEGVGGAEGQYYIPGTPITVTMEFVSSNETPVQQFSFTESLPSGWSLVAESVVADPMPDNIIENPNEVDFEWVGIPEFPFVFSYTLNVPVNAAGEACLSGVAHYQSSGGLLESNTIETCLNVFPCLQMTRSIPTTCYAAGQPLTVEIVLENECLESVTALALEETLPPGWSFVSAAGAPMPFIVPAPGATGSLEFAWITMPVFPYTFTYVVNVPVDQEGDVVISGEALYRFLGPELRTGLLETVICGADLAPPVITLLGAAEVILECGAAYNDAGATALDDVDGDITDQIVVVNPVNVSIPGEYVITYNVSDAAGNAAEEVTRMVIVEDTLRPVITLLGEPEMTVECGTSFEDPGVTALDACDGNLTDAVSVEGFVNPNTPGAYLIRYSVADASGNAAVSVSRTVNVADTTQPVITRLGSAFAIVECGSAYTDAGATAFDACAGDLTGSISIVNPVNTMLPGQYEVVYSVSDPAGNPAAPVTRTIEVRDTTAPAITLFGDDTIIIAVGSTYQDAGATVSDDCDPDPQLEVDNPVTTDRPGLFQVRYTVRDASGNVRTAQRTVLVRDVTPPVITLVGDPEVVIECTEIYTDAGATAVDNVDGDISSRITVTGSVNTSVPGTYTLTYNVRDQANNPATPVTRTIRVVDTVAPEVAITGNPTVTVECGGSYVDAGATATDSCHGDLSDAIVVNNPVNTAVPGVYQVTYTVSDPSGNAAVPAVRTVTVTDSIIPVITLLGDTEVTVECGGSYVDAGATATDSCHGDLSDAIVVNNPVNTAVPGVYQVTYTVSDPSGNAAVPAVRTVTVTDSIIPVITLLGDTEVTVECGRTFSDPGATANDVCDGDLSDVITIDNAELNLFSPGVYYITYAVEDSSGNRASTVRRVSVEDTTPPVITLQGEAVITLDCGEEYVEAGALATDICGGDLSDEIRIGGDVVDTSAPGVFTITYDVTDEAGHAAETVQRTVIVEGPGCEEGELEGEGEPPCELAGVEILSPAGDIRVPADATAWVQFRAAVNFVDPLLCGGGVVEVTYLIDGIVVGVSRDAARNFPAAVELLVGNYVLDAVAVLIDTDEAVAATQSLRIQVGTDSDGNGYLDNPFAELPNTGDTWQAVVSGGAYQRAVSMLTWHGPCNGEPDAPMTMIIAQPEYPELTVKAEIPPELLACGEQGILILAGARDFASLLGPTQAPLLPKIPERIIRGGFPFELSVIVSADGGQTYDELDNTLLAVNPITITSEGLTFSSGLMHSFISYPTLVESDAVSGIRIILDDGAWSMDAIIDPLAIADRLTAQVAALSLFAPVEMPPIGPTLQIMPNPDRDFIVGIAEVNQAATNSLTVKNIGTGTLAGAAILQDPSGMFSLVGASNYNLTRHQTAEIQVRFAPTGTGDFTATLTFIGGENSPITVTLRGVGVNPQKRIGILGCAPAPGRGGVSRADILVILVTLAVCLVTGGVYRRRAARYRLRVNAMAPRDA